MRFWNRQVLLKIGQAGNKALQYENTNGEGLTIDFSVSKDTTKKSNKGVFKIYNMNFSSAKYAALPGSIVEFKAGWDGNIATIFRGAVLSCDDTYSGIDKVTTIIATDGGKEVSDSFIAKQTLNDMDGVNLIRLLAKELGMNTVRVGGDISSVEYPKGYAMIGKSSDILTQICDSMNACWYIDNGILYLCDYYHGIRNTGYEINAASGLLGSPSHIVIDNYFKKNRKKSTSGAKRSSKNGYGYNIKCLLNPYIHIRDIVHISSKIISDYMYIESIKYHGNTNKGDFICDIVGIKTSGK